MMKKITIIVLVGAFSLSLMACAGKNVEPKEISSEASVEKESESLPLTEEAGAEAEEGAELATVEEPKEEEMAEAEPEETVAEAEEPEIAEESETEQEPFEEPKPDSEPKFSFVDMQATKYAKSSVNVRLAPDLSGEKIGSLRQNDEVNITGQCNETGWYRFDYNGRVAYVSNSYIVDEKVEVVVEAPAADNGGEETPAASVAPAKNLKYLTSYDYAGNAYKYPYETGVVYGDGVLSTGNAKAYAESLGYNFDTMLTDENGASVYYYLSSNTIGVSGYDNETLKWSIQQGHIYQIYRIEVNGGQFCVEKVVAY